MKKILFLAGFAIFCTAQLAAQNYPPFQAKIFDTTNAGYYFTCPIKVGPNPTGIRATHTILDHNGHLVYYRRFPANVNSGDFRLQPNGLISFSVQGRFFFMDSTFTVVDSAFCQNGIFQDGHDVQLLPNGHYLLMGFENVPMDLSAYPFFNGNPGSPNASVKSGVIQELDADKNVVFEWHCADHYDFADVDPNTLNNPVNVDWTHLNAVEQDADGNLLISVRHFHEITKINRLDGSIMWRLGGKKNQFNFLNDADMFLAQHDCRRIANGNLTLFDNGGNSLPFHPAAGKEYRLDESAMTAELVWSYVENGNSYSRAMGSTQRLANGNTLINYGIFPDANIVFNVVDTAGNKVFELGFDDTLTAYRSYHYASLPWQLKRPKISCYESNGNFFLDAGSGHGSYLWSSGETSQTIQVTAADTFFVYVPRGPGFISSELFVVGNPNNPCETTSAGEMAVLKTFSVFPNPATGYVTVRLPEAETGVLELTDMAGRKMMSMRVAAPAHELNLDVSGLPPGVYLVRLNGYCGKVVRW